MGAMSGVPWGPGGSREQGRTTTQKHLEKGAQSPELWRPHIGQARGRFTAKRFFLLLLFFFKLNSRLVEIPDSIWKMLKFKKKKQEEWLERSLLEKVIWGLLNACKPHMVEEFALSYKSWRVRAKKGTRGLPHPHFSPCMSLPPLLEVGWWPCWAPALTQHCWSSPAMINLMLKEKRCEKFQMLFLLLQLQWISLNFVQYQVRHK